MLQLTLRSTVSIAWHALTTLDSGTVRPGSRQQQKEEMSRSFAKFTTGIVPRVWNSGNWQKSFASLMLSARQWWAKSWFHLNHDWITCGNLIWVKKRLDLEKFDLIWIWFEFLWFDLWFDQITNFSHLGQWVTSYDDISWYTVDSNHNDH